MDDKRSGFITFLCVILFIITVFLFSTWGYQWVHYILAKSYGVQPSVSIYELFIGLVAMISSIIIFIGAINAWQMKYSASRLIFYGGIGFLIKNVLDIINDFDYLSSLNSVGASEVSRASWAIAGDLFQIAFWIFIMIVFTRQSFKEKLS